MIVRKFLAWAQNAPTAARAAGAEALARGWLHSDLSAEERREALVALTALLDDPALAVRRALASVFAASPHAPRHVISKLAQDHPEVAVPVLARSPLLGDAELIDCAALGGAMAECAVASRPSLSAAACAALAEMAGRDAAVVLARNTAAPIGLAALRRLLERYWDEGALREAILGRADIPAVLRAELVAATARALSSFIASGTWMPEERARRTIREATEQAHLVIAGEEPEAPAEDLRELVAHLRRSGQLTAGFLLRALLAGHLALCETALAELSGVPLLRVRGLLRQPRGAGLAALFARAGVSDLILPAFGAALLAYEEAGRPRGLSGRLAGQMIEGALRACEDMEPSKGGQVVALLRRFEAETACAQAREEAARIAAAPLPALPRREIVIDLAAIEAEILQAA